MVQNVAKDANVAQMILATCDPNVPGVVLCSPTPEVTHVQGCHTQHATSEQTESQTVLHLAEGVHYFEVVEPPLEPTFMMSSSTIICLVTSYCLHWTHHGIK